jgi:hypothetical protein
MRRVLLTVILSAIAVLPAAGQGAADVRAAADATTTGSIAPQEMDAAEAPAAPVSDWIGKPIVSADGVEVGTVADVKVDEAGRPAAVTTEVGGFLGFGSTPVELTVDDTDFDGEEVRVGMVRTDIDALAAGGPMSPAANRDGPD